MKLPFPHHHLYRYGAILLAVFLFYHAALIAFIFISTPTDENIFRDAPARIMSAKGIPGSITAKRAYDGGINASAMVRTDSVEPGDLVLSINNGAVKTIKDALDAVERNPGPDVRFEVLRPSANTVFTFVVPRSAVGSESFVLLPKYVYVTTVLPGGASDRGGMKPGDLILRINDQEFSNAIEADRILRLGQIGKSLRYEVLRSNRFLQLNIVLAKFGISIALLLFTLNGLVWMGTGLFLVAARPNLKAARLIGFGFMLLGFFLTTLLIRRDFFLTPEIIIRQVIIGIAFVLGSSMLFHASLYFPLERSDLTSKRWLIRGFYIVPVIAVGLSAALNSPVPVVLVLLYGAFVMVRYRKGASAEYVRYNRVLKWTSAGAGLICGATVIFFGASLQTVGLGVIGAAMAGIPLSYLFVIARYRLLDMNFRVRRNTQYSIVTVLWGTAVFYGLVWAFFRLPSLDLPQANIVFTGTAIEVNDAPELAGQRGASERVMLMALAIALTFVVLRVRRSGQRFIDKKYFRQEYDYRRASVELGEVMATTLSAEELAKGLVQKLSGLMTLKRTGVLFFKEQECCSCLAVHGFDGTAWEQFCLSHDRELIDAVRQFRNEFRVDYLPALFKEQFHSAGFHHGIPIRSKEKVIGVLLVGEKQSESTFRQEDLAFLATTAKQASVAIENAFLYGELAEKERMKHELQIARRIQLDSLPQMTPVVQGLEIAGVSVPAMEVGGDFFDYLTNGNGKFTVVIGDVSGKGTSAALYMSKVQGILRSLHGFDLPPKELFRRANTLLCQDLEKRSFVTVLGAEFDTARRSAVVSRAGHLPLWHFHAADARVTKILPRGLGLGLNDASIFQTEMEERQLSYAPGDIFLFATDGVTEAHNDSGDFGEDRLLELLLQTASAPAAVIQDRLLTALKEFTGDREQHDDQTLVIVKAV